MQIPFNERSGRVRFTENHKDIRSRRRSDIKGAISGKNKEYNSPSSLVLISCKDQPNSLTAPIEQLGRFWVTLFGPLLRKKVSIWTVLEKIGLLPKRIYSYLLVVVGREADLG